METPKLFHPYFCKHSQQAFAILRAGKFKDSFLPINLSEDLLIEDEFFDVKKHKSHLLTCEHCFKVWEDVKRELKAADRQRINQQLKDNCK